jgi:hypothetical protein
LPGSAASWTAISVTSTWGENFAALENSFGPKALPMS